jgi:hypothetical protein
MSQPFETQSEKWWRFDEPEVRDGYLVPARGTRGQLYDPWQVHRDWQDGKVEHHPLDELLAICSTAAGPVPAEAAICAWAKEYGPLGVLLHRTISIVRPTEPIADTTRVVHHQFIGAWFSRFWSVPRDVLLDPKTTPLRAVLRSEQALSAETIEGPLSVTWGPYFPNIPKHERDHAMYVAPYEPGMFAAEYAEPVIEWANWAGKLQRAVACFREGASFSDRTTGAMVLTALASVSSQTLDVADAKAKPRLRARSPALLSALALMALHRIANGESARVCKRPDCDAVFLPVNPRAEYHSDKCRWRHLKSRQRVAAKTKTKRATKRKAGRHA